jgi:hypothetical protein
MEVAGVGNTFPEIADFGAFTLPIPDTIPYAL